MSNTTNCPICDAPVSIQADVEDSEIITCQECGNRAVVKKTPEGVKLEEAPEVEEDWGE